MESTRSAPSSTAGADRSRAPLLSQTGAPITAEKENAGPDINALIMNSKDMRREYA